jgi:hypothetical protein
VKGPVGWLRFRRKRHFFLSADFSLCFVSQEDGRVALLESARKSGLTHSRMDTREAADASATAFPFNQLPPELQTHIFLVLDLGSLAAATQVSETWHSMIEEQVMWKLK